jgi:hypothetical protein
MKNILKFMFLCALAASIGLGLLISCDEEKTVNSNPIACLKITSFQQSGGLKSANAGGSYTFNREIKNDGPSDAKDVTLGYYLSTDDKITTSDTPLNVDDKLDLPSGTCNTKNVDIKIPASAVPGTKYYIGVLVTSSSCTNNCPDFKSCEITITDDRKVDTVCLSIETWGFRDEHRSLAVRGNEMLVLTGTIKNNGTITCSNVNIKFYISDDTVIDPQEDTYLDYLEYPVEIQPGKTQTIDPWIFIPNNLVKNKEYYIGMLITSSSCENTCTPYAVFKVFYEPEHYVSNSFQILEWSRENPEILPHEGDTVRLIREIKNDSDMECRNIRVEYYLSKEEMITTDDYFMGSETFDLSAGESNKGTIDLTIPLGSSRRSWYWAVILIKSSSCTELYNPYKTFILQIYYPYCLVSGTIDNGPGPTQPTDVTCGNTYTFRRKVVCDGNRDCNVTLRYYLSTDCSFSTDDMYLGVEEHLNLASSSENSGNIDLTIPAGLAPDMYHISYLITSGCITNSTPIGWDIAVACPSLSDPIGAVRPDQKLKASCH